MVLWYIHMYSARPRRKKNKTYYRDRISEKSIKTEESRARPGFLASTHQKVM